MNYKKGIESGLHIFKTSICLPVVSSKHKTISDAIIAFEVKKNKT